MARVNPDDDSIRRFIVRHYRYDPERHERRHVMIAAFDNEREFEAYVHLAATELGRNKRRGRVGDRKEHISGVVQEAGHRRRQQNARLVQRALDRGVSSAALLELELPENAGAMRHARPTGRPSRRKRIMSRVQSGVGQRARDALRRLKSRRKAAELS